MDGVMIPICIQGALVVEPGNPPAKKSVLFSDRIMKIMPSSDKPPAEATIIDGCGRLLTPGLIDLHTHGIGPHLYEAGPADLVDGLRLLPKFGTTTVLPTLYSVLKPESLPKIERLTAALSQVTTAHVPGFHLEGPFLAITGAGAMTMKTDLVFLDELISACGGKVAAMSISPEVSGIVKVIEKLTSAGVATFITHTRASVDQTQAAISAGARHATHFYDVFPMPEETEPGVRTAGVVEVMLSDLRTTVDFIADGVHVHPVAIQASIAAKGIDSVIAITDSNIGAGLDDGIFETQWGYSVQVSRHDATRVGDRDHALFGRLAGSSLTLNRAVQNLHQWFSYPSEDIWRMATSNPALALKLVNRGVIQKDAHADLVLWNQDFTPKLTWLGGQLVYRDLSAGE